MSRLGQRVRIRGAEGGASAARCVSRNGVTLASGNSWVQVYTGSGAHDWDIAGEDYWDGSDEMVIPVTGVYLVNGSPNLWKPTHPSSGSIRASLTRNGDIVATYVLSFQQSDSRGSVDEPSISWVGPADEGDRFAISVLNQTNQSMSAGYWSIFLGAYRIA